MPINLRSLAQAVQASLRILDRFRAGAAGPPADRGTRRQAAGTTKPRRPAAPRSAARPSVPPSPSAAARAAYAGDFSGTSTIRYAPQTDGAPDPGEVVWAWVPYEEDHSRGKDRPVLLIGHNGPYLLALMLTSKDHDQHPTDADDYVDVGTGNWDRQSRPSEANIGRVLQLNPESIRREGAVLDKARFDLVAAGLRRRHGWK
ncbi:type II toxin-antitoxin system PemK/MazF family toxin [Arthrobacter sp. D1-29]